eukprot:GEMP01007999.1.p1 GENE.GEMP01007999.1~~GEMP01007999.1.p1  ORF type:complete len:971 (-),score=321.54 GEMP01007999.1:531-3443(-)
MAAIKCPVRLVPIIRRPVTAAAHSAARSTLAAAGGHMDVNNPRADSAGHTDVQRRRQSASWAPREREDEAACAQADDERICAGTQAQARAGQCVPRSVHHADTTPVVVVVDEDSDVEVDVGEKAEERGAAAGEHMAHEEEEGDAHTDADEDDAGSIRDWAELEAELEAELGYVRPRPEQQRRHRQIRHEPTVEAHDAAVEQSLVGATPANTTMVAPPARPKASMSKGKSFVPRAYDGSPCIVPSTACSSTKQAVADVVPAVETLTSHVAQLRKELDVERQKGMPAHQLATMCAQLHAIRQEVKALDASSHAAVVGAHKRVPGSGHDDIRAETVDDRAQRQVGGCGSAAANVDGARANAGTITAGRRDAEAPVEPKAGRGRTPSRDEPAEPGNKRARVDRSRTPVASDEKELRAYTLAGDPDLQAAQHYTMLHLNDTLLEFKNRAPAPIVRCGSTVGETSEVMVCSFPGCAKTWRGKKAFHAWVVGERDGSFRDYERHYVISHILNNERRVMTEDMCLPTIGRHRTIAIRAPCDDCDIEQTQVVECNDNNLYRRVCADCFADNAAVVRATWARGPQSTNSLVLHEEKRPRRAVTLLPPMQLGVSEQQPKRKSGHAVSVTSATSTPSTSHAGSLHSHCEAQEEEEEDARCKVQQQCHQVPSTNHQGDGVDAECKVQQQRHQVPSMNHQGDGVEALGEDKAVEAVDEDEALEAAEALAVAEALEADRDWTLWCAQDGQSDLGVDGGQRRSAGKGSQRLKPPEANIDIVDISSDDMDEEARGCEDDTWPDAGGTSGENDATAQRDDAQVVALDDDDEWWRDVESDDGEGQATGQVNAMSMRSADRYEEVARNENVDEDIASSVGDNDGAGDVFRLENNSAVVRSDDYKNCDAGSRHAYASSAWRATLPKTGAVRLGTRQRWQRHARQISTGKKRNNREMRGWKKRGHGRARERTQSGNATVEDDTEGDSRWEHT